MYEYKFSAFCHIFAFAKKIGDITAEVAELVDALDSKSSGGNIVWVRVPPSVPAIAKLQITGMAELVDAHVSGACGATCAGSSPASGTS